MTFNRLSYLPSSAQADTYNQLCWPRNTLKSYAPQARSSYVQGLGRVSYAPRVPTLLRQAQVSSPAPVSQPARPALDGLVAAA